MFKRIFSTLIMISMLISMFVPQMALANNGNGNGNSNGNSNGNGNASVSDTSGLSVQVEQINSWNWWIDDAFWGHGHEDLYKNNHDCNDYIYQNKKIQYIKVKITNNTNSNIELNKDNPLILQFTNTSGKELGLKLYDFVAYQNIDKSTRNYTFGSNWFTSRKIKKNSTYEIYGYVKWMDFSELNCTIQNQVKGNEVEVRLTSNNDKSNLDSKISSELKLYNEGTNEIDLNKIRIHYYFNMDGDLNKVAPKAQMVKATVYDYQLHNFLLFVYGDYQVNTISTLPYSFINMGEFSTNKANCYLELGFPSTGNGNSNGNGNGHYIYNFLRHYNDDYWCYKYAKKDYNWYDDILNNYIDSNDKSKSNDIKHRWWWNWDKDYTSSDKDYSLNKQIGDNKSYVTIDLAIIKEMLAGVTGTTADIKFNQTNHYSYNPQNEIDWDKVTVYYDGKLIWGEEPRVTMVAPTNLQATAKKEGIFLKWDEVNDAQSYRILRKAASDTDFIELPDGISTNSFVDVNVKPGETYTYKVKAVSDNGELGPLSNEVSLKAFVLTVNGLYAEYLNWESVPNSDLTNYEYDENNNFNTNYVLTNTEFALARIDPKIDFTANNANPYYKWGKIAPDSKVNADCYSVIWSGYVMPKYSESYTFFTNTDDGVKLWVDTDKNGTFENDELVIDDWSLHSTRERATQSPIALRANQKYKIKMEYFEKQVDATAQLLWSSSKQAKEVIPTSQLFVDGTVAIPEKPTNLNATAQDNMTVELIWDPVLDATGYIIYQTDMTGKTNKFTVENNSFYTTSALVAGDYTYAVSAYNDAGESEKSDQDSVSVGLAAPSNLTATVTGKSVKLGWDAVNGATGYKIYRVNDGVTTTITRGANEYTDTDVSWGEVYSYCVVALKNDSEGIKSEAVNGPIAPSVPTNLTANLSDFTKVTLNWTASQGAQSYKVYRSESSNGTYSQIASGVTGTNYLDSTIPTPAESTVNKYYYKVVAVNNTIESEYSNFAEVTVYIDTDIGTLSCYIIKNKPQTNFVLGSYIPIAFEMTLKKSTKNLTFVLDDVLENANLTYQLKAELVTNNNINGAKLFNTVVPKGHERGNSIGNSIVFNGNYLAGDVIRVEFVLKVSASSGVLQDGINKYYDKSYQLKFTMSEEKSNVKVPSTSIISLPIKIVKPDKLK